MTGAGANASIPFCTSWPHPEVECDPSPWNFETPDKVARLDAYAAQLRANAAACAALHAERGAAVMERWRNAEPPAEGDDDVVSEFEVRFLEDGARSAELRAVRAQAVDERVARCMAG